MYDRGEHDGRLLAAKLTGRIEPFDVASGRSRHKHDVQSSAWTLAFTPDGKNLLAGHTDKKVRVWAVPETF